LDAEPIGSADFVDDVLLIVEVVVDFALW